MNYSHKLRTVFVKKPRISKEIRDPESLRTFSRWVYRHWELLPYTASCPAKPKYGAISQKTSIFGRLWPCFDRRVTFPSHSRAWGSNTLTGWPNMEQPLTSQKSWEFPGFTRNEGTLRRSFENRRSFQWNGLFTKLCTHCIIMQIK